jgi:carbon storage regulator
MLVLSRKKNESVVVGGPGCIGQVLKITVLEINGDRVRLGFDADTAIPIHRSEVWEKVFAGNVPNGCAEEPKTPVA